MSESKALTVRQDVTPEVWEMINEIAPVVYKGGLFGVGSETQAASIMLKGHEIGLPLAASFEFIHVVQGKPTISPRGALALIHQSGVLEHLEIDDIVDANGMAEACEVTMKRTNGFEYTARFSMKDATKAGIVKSGGAWSSYPGNMLRWRAVGFCADVVFPDVIGGLKRVDELGGDITPEGDASDWQVIEPEPKPEPLTENESVTARLKGFIDKFGAANVNGAMPNEFELTIEMVETLGHILHQECDGCLKSRGYHDGGVLCAEATCDVCGKAEGVHVRGEFCAIESEIVEGETAE